MTITYDDYKKLDGNFEVSRRIFKDVHKGIISFEAMGVYMYLRSGEDILPVVDVLDLLYDMSPDPNEETKAAFNSLIEKKIIKLTKKDGLQYIEFLKYK